MRNRSVVFVIRDKKILMEKLCYEGRTFYSIPGSGVEDGLYCNILVEQYLEKYPEEIKGRMDKWSMILKEEVFRQDDI